MSLGKLLTDRAMIWIVRRSMKRVTGWFLAGAILSRVRMFVMTAMAVMAVFCGRLCGDVNMLSASA